MRIDNTVCVAKVSADPAGSRRARGDDHQPGQGLLSPRPATRSWTWRGTTPRSPRARCAASPGGRSCSSATSNGAEGEPFFQKRAPEQHPEWVETVELQLSLGTDGARDRRARRGPAAVDRATSGASISNPHPVRADDLEHPDELRVDLDPGPGVSWDDVRRVALIVRDVLGEHELRGWPKTSGSRGIHVYVRIERRWSFEQVRRATLAVAREVERRAPDLATQQMVEGGTPRRLHRLQPERQGPHRGVGLVGAADARRARVDAARVGRGRRLRSGGVHAGHRARRGLAERGDASAGIDGAAGSLDRLPRAVGRAGSRRPRRRAVAAALQEATGRAAARRCRRAARREPARPRAREAPERPPPVDSATHHDRQGAAQGGRARRPRALEGRDIRRPRRGCRSTTSSSIRCAAARPHGRGSASTCATFPRASARRGSARSRLRSLARRRSGAPSVRARRRRARARRRA